MRWLVPLRGSVQEWVKHVGCCAGFGGHEAVASGGVLDDRRGVSGERRTGSGQRRAKVRSSERGTVTAEFAVVLPALVLVLILVVGAGVIEIAQVRVYEAARAGAREAARGEPSQDIEKAAKRKAGPGSTVTVSQGGGYAKVHVKTTLPKALHPVMKEVEASAEARTEGESHGSLDGY